MKKNMILGLVLLGIAGGVFIYMRKKPSAINVPRQQNPLEKALTQSIESLKAMTAPGSIFHNPLNIRYTTNSAKNPWKGQTGFWEGTHGKFVKFDTDENGFRAAAYLLRNYAKEGVTTLAAIINKWAPPNENDTSKYVTFVTKQLKLLTPYTPIAPSQWPLLLQAMAKMETGKTYSLDVIKKGISLL
jgi:hypothetical protein